MNRTTNRWNKRELQTYILLLCANADSEETTEELDLIKTKVDDSTFQKMHQEIKMDSEEISLEKIEDNLEYHEYSGKELAQLRREMRAIYFTDKNFDRMERNLDRILDNILY